MSSDVEEGECFSDYSACHRCGKSFADCKAWSNHIKSCYKNYNAGFDKHGSVTVATNYSSGSSDLEHQESENLSLDLMGYLSGGWGKKRERGSLGTSPSNSSGLSIDHESKIVLQIGDSFSKKREPVVEEKLQDQLELYKKFKVGVTEEEKGFDHSLLLGYSFNTEKKEVQESRNLNKKVGLDHQVKHRCKKCGREFDDFRGLGGHMSVHNRMKIMEEQVSDDEDSKAKKKKSKEAHQCDQCGKCFRTGQALGGHKRVHKNAYLMKRFDLNQLPPEAKLFNLENDHTAL